MAPQSFLTEATFYLLLSLNPGPAHGYALLKSVQHLSGGAVKLSTSTLYTALARLLDQGLIERVSDPQTATNNRPRKIYRLTGAGSLALAGEKRRIQRMLAATRMMNEEIGA